MAIRVNNKILGAPPQMKKFYDLSASVGHSTSASDNHRDDVLLVQYLLNKIYRDTEIRPVARLEMDGIFGPITHYWMLHFMAAIRANPAYLNIPGNYTFAPMAKAASLLGGEGVSGGDGNARNAAIAAQADANSAPSAAWDMFLQTWIGQMNFMVFEHDPLSFNDLTTKDPLMPNYLKNVLDHKIRA